MKKLATALAVAAGFAVATPAVLACPNMDKDQQTADKKDESAPKTADQPKAKDTKAPTEKAADKSKPTTDKKPAAKG